MFASRQRTAKLRDPKRIVLCQIIDKNGKFFGNAVEVSMASNSSIASLISKLKREWAEYSVAVCRIMSYAVSRRMTSEEKGLCSNKKELNEYVKNLALSNESLDPTMKISELKSFIGTSDYPLIIQLPIVQNLKVNTDEDGVVENVITITRIEGGQVSKFYSNSFIDEIDRVSAFSQWNINKPLRRFIRLLRDYSVIDLYSLNQCQSAYNCPTDAASLHCVWQNEPSLDFNVLSTVIASTSLDEVSACVENSQFLRQTSDSYKLLSELQNIRPLATTVNPPPTNEKLMNYLNSIFYLAADFEFQERQSCNGNLRMEMMASGPIYTPMLHMALGRTGPHLESLFKFSELNLTCMKAYVSEHYADMSVAIKGNQNRLYPTFIAEYATGDDQDVTTALSLLNMGNCDDTITKFYERLLSHKDREKLVGAMAAALMQIVSSLLQFDDYYSKEDFERIRIWGALVDNWTFLFLQMRLHIPTNEMYLAMKSGQFDMLLVTQPEWMIMLQSVDAVQIVNAREFIVGSVKIWDMCQEINRDSAIIAELLGRLKDIDPLQATGSLGDICFRTEVTTMSKSITSTANFETPNAKRGFATLPRQKRTRNTTQGSNNDNVMTFLEDVDENISMTFDEFLAGGQDQVTKALESALKMLQERDFTIENVGPVRRNDMPVLVQVSRNQVQFMALIKPTVRCRLKCELLDSIRSKHVVPLLHYEPIQSMRDPWILMIEPILHQDQSLLLDPKHCPDQVKRYRNVLELCSDALKALKALQDSLIIHRDIKPQHLMRNRIEECWVLIDLDCSLSLTHLQEIVYDDPKVWHRGPPGTQGFRAPEVEQRQGYGFAADMFSMGQTLMTIISSQNSFSLTDKKLNPWCHRVKKDLTNLLYQMIDKDPSERPFVTTALRYCNVLQSTFSENDDPYHVYGSIEHRLRSTLMGI